MYAAVLHGRLVFFRTSSELSFGVSDEEVFAELKMSLASFLRGNAAQTPCR